MMKMHPRHHLPGLGSQNWVGDIGTRLSDRDVPVALPAAPHFDISPLAPDRSLSPPLGWTSPGTPWGLAGDTWPVRGRKPLLSPSTVPPICQPHGRARCRGHTLSCEYPASAKGDNGDGGDTAKGFRSSHPASPREGENPFVVIHINVISVGCLLWGEEWGKMGDRVLWLAGTLGRKHS